MRLLLNDNKKKLRAINFLGNAAELFEKLQEQLAIQIREDKLQAKRAERQLRLLQRAEAKKEAEVKSATAEKWQKQQQQQQHQHQHQYQHQHHQHQHQLAAAAAVEAAEVAPAAAISQKERRKNRCENESERVKTFQFHKTERARLISEKNKFQDEISLNKKKNKKGAVGLL